MYFLDFFAGIGLFRLGLEQAGFTCKGHCEIDKYANMSYEAMHNPKEDEWFEKDITKVRADSLPDVDLWTGGAYTESRLNSPKKEERLKRVTSSK